MFDAAVAGRMLDDTVGGCLLDADGDGDLDVYVANLLTSDRLLLNNGRAAFETAGPEVGLDTVDGSEAVVCTDLDQDGDIDVVVATMGRGLVFHENLGAPGGRPRFATLRFLADRPPGPRAPLSSWDMSGLVSADFSGDGSLEVYVGVSHGCDLVLRWNGAGRLETVPVAREGPLCGSTMSATPIDVDGDGRLELLVLTDGGIWLADGFSSQGVPETVSSVKGLAALGQPRAVIRGDFNGDGTLDALVGGGNGATALLAGGGGPAARLCARLTGPPWNRSAVGAQVRLRRERDGAFVALRQIGGAGFNGQDSKDVCFAGLEAGGRYEMVITLPGPVPRTVVRSSAPGRVEVALSSGTLPDWLRAPLYRLESFTAERWNFRWLLATIGLGLFAFAAAWALALVSPLGMPGFRLAAFMGGLVVALAWLAWLTVPLDAGWVAIGVTLAAGLGGGGLGLLWVVTRRRLSAVQSAQVELFERLSVFRHNETPRKVADRLRFLCTNLRGTKVDADRRKVALLRQDVDAYASIVLAELSAMARIARIAGVPEESRGAGLEEIQHSLRRLCEKILRRREIPSDAELGRLERWLAVADQRLEALGHFAAARLRVRPVPLIESWLSTRASRTSLHITPLFEVDADMEVLITADELQRVLDILLENSERSIGQHGGPNDIRLRVRAADGGVVCIDFEDRGRGVATAMKRRIFQPGVSGFTGGHGYGLDFARRSLGKFGASIEEVGREGEGACFVVTLKRVGSSGSWSQP
ncbi:MAG: FG-GAP-like repeat-containing protein [Acidobacteriota bacterium]|nr:FG-GAP-like repeat-containing protein [Acidobacteriota bacterium]